MLTSDDSLVPADISPEEERRHRERWERTERAWAELAPRMRSRHGRHLQRVANEVVERGSPELRSTIGTIHVRLHRFWNRTGILERRFETSGSEGEESVARLERQQMADPLPVIADYLLWDLVQRGWEPTPAA